MGYYQGLALVRTSLEFYVTIECDNSSVSSLENKFGYSFNKK